MKSGEDFTLFKMYKDTKNTIIKEHTIYLRCGMLIIYKVEAYSL